MTLIATMISRYGIIQASDSNLTSPSGAVTTGKKVFRLGFANGALSVAGAYARDEPRLSMPAVSRTRQSAIRGC